MSEEMIEEVKSEEKTVKEEAAEEREVVFEEALEAMLFAAGHPITYQTIARVLEMTPAKVKDKVFEYSIKYNNSEIPRGVILLTYHDSCQLCTKQQYLSEIRDALGIRKSGTLSSSALEVLAIVAYNQPVTRAFIDTLRRVDSSYAVGSLLDRGLIESKGRLDVPGRPMLYGTTSDFLRSFGLADLDSLPKTSDELLEVFAGAKQAESQNSEQRDEEQIADAEQLSVDIDGIIDGEDKPAENADEPKTEETVSPDYLDEPSADDDVNND